MPFEPRHRIFSEGSRTSITIGPRRIQIPQFSESLLLKVDPENPLGILPWLGLPAAFHDHGFAGVPGGLWLDSAAERDRP